MKEYLLLSSTSEHKIRVFGHSWPELVANALKGMFESIEAKPDLDKKPISRKFDVNGFDRESLLVNFLSEALYLSSVHHEAYYDVNFTSLSDICATGIIKGHKISGFAGCEIKAVTHHDMHIISKDSMLQTDILFDV
jgi:SHS2 domain-containing protein